MFLLFVVFLLERLTPCAPIPSQVVYDRLTNWHTGALSKCTASVLIVGALSMLVSVYIIFFLGTEVG